MADTHTKTTNYNKGGLHFRETDLYVDSLYTKTDLFLVQPSGIQQLITTGVYFDVEDTIDSYITSLNQPQPSLGDILGQAIKERDENNMSNPTPAPSFESYVMPAYDAYTRWNKLHEDIRRAIAITAVHQKIPAIKAIRKLIDCGLMEGKNIAEAMANEYNHKHSSDY